MQIFIGTDHGGFEQKELLRSELQNMGHEVHDLGTHNADSVDYPEYAVKVAREVVANPGSLGVLLCRSGEGMEITANKVKGIRASLVWRPDVAAETRHDNDANILVLPSDFVADTDMIHIAKTFIDTPFSGEERHQRRIDQIHELERS